MARGTPEIPVADGTASPCRRSPRFNAKEIKRNKKKEENRSEKKTAKTQNRSGLPSKKKVSIKELLEAQPRPKRSKPIKTDAGPAKRKRAVNDRKETTTTMKKINCPANPVGRPRGKNKEGDDRVKAKSPVGRPWKKKKKRGSNVKAAKASANVKAEVEEEEGRVVTRVMEIGQVWAFPNGGGFPHNYARIDRIIPIPPLVEVTPLIPQSILDEEKRFAERGIAYSCGVFKASQSKAIKDIALFTHKAKFELGGEGRDLYKIFPRKGEIWAVYWNSSSEFKLVEALSDFSEKDGVNVYALSKVEGMNGVYQRQLPEGFYMIRCFSRGFMPMFSHRVPATILEESAAMRWKVAFH